MLTVDSCSSADADRLLGLADQTLEEWAEDTVKVGQRDEDYEERFRPLLVSAPALLRALKQIASVCRGSAAPMAARCAAIVQAAVAGLAEDDLTVSAPFAPRRSPFRSGLPRSGRQDRRLHPLRRRNRRLARLRNPIQGRSVSWKLL
jgi:hypothetical protein